MCIQFEKHVEFPSNLAEHDSITSRENGEHELLRFTISLQTMNKEKTLNNCITYRRADCNKKTCNCHENSGRKHV